MADQLKITVGDVAFTATLRDTPTATAVAAACPIEGSANTWGEEVYFGAALDVAPESDQRAVVEAGEIAYWLEGNAIAIGYGPTPVSQGDEIRLAAPVNIFADADPDDVRKLKGSTGGEPVKVEVV
ncbi:MAG: cyclophilin-like fold protein [Rhodovibrio sp.]|nr:cyclophilin-like fold protein [Rhodovibrio sp.]